MRTICLWLPQLPELPQKYNSSLPDTENQINHVSAESLIPSPRPGISQKRGNQGNRVTKSKNPNKNAGSLPDEPVTPASERGVTGVTSTLDAAAGAVYPPGVTPGGVPTPAEVARIIAVLDGVQRLSDDVWVATCPVDPTHHRQSLQIRAPGHDEDEDEGELLVHCRGCRKGTIDKAISQRIGDGYQPTPPGEQRGFPSPPAKPGWGKKYTRALTISGRLGWYRYPDPIVVPPDAYVPKPSTWDGDAPAAWSARKPARAAKPSKSKKATPALPANYDALLAKFAQRQQARVPLPGAGRYENAATAQPANSGFELPLKWAGGKRWLIPKLQELFTPYRDRRLVEVFAGGAAISFGLRPARALLNDVNQHLVNFYHWLQRGLTIDPAMMRMDQAYYYEQRKRFNELIRTAGGATSKEAAMLFFYLNRCGYNGLYRVNRKGEFNVPCGRPSGKFNYPRDLSAFQRIAKPWQFTAGDFERVELKPDDFLYADPPFDTEFVQYVADGFSWADQQRLVKWLLRHPGPTVVSGQATRRILALYQTAGFTINTLEASRGINSDIAKRKDKAIEMLATRSI